MAKKVLMISADMFEDVELLAPLYRLKEEGIRVSLASMGSGAIKGKHGYEVKPDVTLRDVKPGDYDMLVLPGGKAPASVRKDEDALRVVRHFFEKNKPVAAICHGPQILISAGVMKGRTATSYKSVQKELADAGANAKDREVVVDGNLVTSRQPSDIPAFLRELMKKVR
jgi:protease I